MNEVITFLLGVLASGFVAAIVFYIQRKEHDPHIKIKVFNTEKTDKRSYFYELLKKAITEANEEIVQYAEGFNTTAEGRMESAESYIDDIRSALRKNKELKWKRIQSLNPTDQGWQDMLQSTVNSFHPRFNAINFDNIAGDHLASIVLVDPNSKSKSKVFIMISKSKNIDGKTVVNLAHSGVMIQGSSILARCFDDRLDSFLQECSAHMSVMEPAQNKSVDSTR